MRKFQELGTTSPCRLSGARPCILASATMWKNWSSLLYMELKDSVLCVPSFRSTAYQWRFVSVQDLLIVRIIVWLFELNNSLIVSDVVLLINELFYPVRWLEYNSGKLSGYGPANIKFVFLFLLWIAVE